MSLRRVPAQLVSMDGSVRYSTMVAECGVMGSSNIVIIKEGMSEGPLLWAGMEVGQPP